MQRDDSRYAQERVPVKRLTIRDIARLAGVSKSTVSRVLNHSPHLDEETRQRVLYVMQEQGFVASANARGLNGRSRLIGMVVPDLSWSLIAAISKGIAHAAQQIGYEILFYGGNHSDDYHDIAERILTNNLVAGLVAIVFMGSAKHMEKLYQQGLPVIMIDIIGTDVAMPVVGADNVGGMYSIVHHLTELGHKRIGYIQGPPEFTCSYERYQGYCKALTDAGVALDPELVLPGNFTIVGGRTATERFLSLQEAPTAIVASNDLTAFGVLEVAKERGIAVPDALSVVGFDDEPKIAHTRPTLTTVHQPFFEMGQCAAELLLSRIEPGFPFPEQWKHLATTYTVGEDAEDAQTTQPCRITLPTTLIPRESSSAPS